MGNWLGCWYQTRFPSCWMDLISNGEMLGSKQIMCAAIQPWGSSFWLVNVMNLKRCWFAPLFRNMCCVFWYHEASPPRGSIWYSCLPVSSEPMVVQQELTFHLWVQMRAIAIILVFLEFLWKPWSTTQRVLLVSHFGFLFGFWRKHSNLRRENFIEIICVNKTISYDFLGILTVYFTLFLLYLSRFPSVNSFLCFQFLYQIPCTLLFPLYCSPQLYSSNGQFLFFLVSEISVRNVNIWS